MRTIDVDGRACVDDLLRALGLTTVPEGCKLALDDEVEIAVTADAEAIQDEIEDMFGEEAETLPLEHLRDALCALREGRTATAETLLSYVFGGPLAPEMAAVEGALRARAA